jgi:hypothetical protein
LGVDLFFLPGNGKVAPHEQVVGQIGQGLLELLGIGQDDSEAQIKPLADKLIHHQKRARAKLSPKGGLMRPKSKLANL